MANETKVQRTGDDPTIEGGCFIPEAPATSEVRSRARCENCAARLDERSDEHVCPSDDVRCIQLRAYANECCGLLARSHALLEMTDKQPKRLLAEIEALLGWVGDVEMSDGPKNEPRSETPQGAKCPRCDCVPCYPDCPFTPGPAEPGPPETGLPPFDPACGDCTSAHDVVCRRHARAVPPPAGSVEHSIAVALKHLTDARKRTEDIDNGVLDDSPIANAIRDGIAWLRRARDGYRNERLTWGGYTAKDAADELRRMWEQEDWSPEAASALREAHRRISLGGK